MAEVQSYSSRNNAARPASTTLASQFAAPFARAFGKEIASLTVESHQFYALVDKGTTFNQFLDILACKYGGEVTRQHFDFGDMIVSVKLGNTIISGDLHFFLGTHGIPMAADSNGSLAFPNGDEMFIGAHTRAFSIRPVSYNANPTSVDELNQSGRVYVSAQAQQVMQQTDLTQQQIQVGHGGVRSEKLMLDESKILSYNILDNSLGTVAEHASKVEGFNFGKFEPMVFQLQTLQPTLTFQTAQGQIQLPMDGSLLRVPYLQFKMFDGNTDGALRDSRGAVQVISPYDEINPYVHSISARSSAQLSAVVYATSPLQTSSLQISAQTPTVAFVRSIQPQNTTRLRFGTDSRLIQVPTISGCTKKMRQDAPRLLASPSRQSPLLPTASTVIDLSKQQPNLWNFRSIWSKYSFTDRLTMQKPKANVIPQQTAKDEMAKKRKPTKGNAQLKDRKEKTSKPKRGKAKAKMLEKEQAKNRKAKLLEKERVKAKNKANPNPLIGKQKKPKSELAKRDTSLLPRVPKLKSAFRAKKPVPSALRVGVPSEIQRQRTKSKFRKSKSIDSRQFDAHKELRKQERKSHATIWVALRQAAQSTSSTNRKSPPSNLLRYNRTKYRARQSVYDELLGIYVFRQCKRSGKKLSAKNSSAV